MTMLVALALVATQGDPLLSIDLPAQPVGAGLDRLARQAGEALVARPGDLAGRRSPALHGRMRLSTALARWCAPAALSCRRIAGGIVVRAMGPVPRAIPLRARPGPPPEDPMTSPDVIVSGRRGTTVQGELERSYSASHLDAVELARRAPQSLAELLSGLPGLWVDSSAGVAANTIRVRGIPLDGYQAIAVQEDGLPVQHDTLPWTDIDQFVRPDLMIESSDYVRGGPSAIFVSNAPGGVLNLRTRAPRDRAGGETRATTADYGLIRWEGYATGSVGGGWRVIAGGSVARDPTVRRIASTLGGGQYRVRADHDLGGGGRMSLAVHGLDDDTLNISSFPMRYDGGRITPLPGFDPRRGSFLGPELTRLRFAALGDRPLGRNNRNRMVTPSLAWTQPVAGGVLTLRTHYRASRTERYALSSSGGAIPAAQAIADALPRLTAAFPATTQIALRHASDGSAFVPLPGNDRVIVLNPVAADTRLNEAIVDLSYAHALEAAGHHDLTLGLYAVGYRWDFRRAVARALLEARDQGRRLDLVALDGSGRVLGRATDEGLLSTGSTYEAVQGHQQMIALYAADEWQLSPRWRLDWGLRHERAALSATVERPMVMDGGDPTTLADDRIAVGSGLSDARAKRIARTAATLAVHWRASDRLGAFARATRAMRLPDPGVFRIGGSDQPRALTIEQAELGLIWRHGTTGLDATLFASRFPDIALPDLSLDPATGAVRVGAYQAAARTIGLEVGAGAAPLPGLSLRATVTWQDPRLQSYRVASLTDGAVTVMDLSGRIPRRVPRIMASLSASAALPGTGVTLDGDLSAMGRRYADDANSLALPGFALVNMGARFDATEALTLRLRATNLFDRIAIMQGDALGGEVRAGDNGGVVTVRAQQGRVVSLSADWRF
ncbi:TonB-dependent receptor [Sphingomonas sp. gentR]|uniref:TonB-dependent receptor domain-containing protein n=1 Tax=Sphingomonas sp. gentR TaxID=3118768 RepID=UPI00177DD4CF